MNKFYAHLMYFFVIYSCKYENAGFTWTTLYNTDNVTKKISTLNISDLVYIVIDSRAEPILRLLTYKACVLLKYNKEKGYDS